MSKSDMRWCVEDLVLERFSTTSPYRQGELNIEELRAELDKFRINSIPNLVTLAPYDIIKPYTI